MKNWSTTKKVVVALIVIAIIVAIYNWKAISNKLGMSQGNASNQRLKGGCIKHTGASGSVWYTFGGVEVSKQDCLDRGYL